MNRLNGKRYTRCFHIDGACGATSILLLSLLIAGCQPVGPDYHPPQMNTPAAWTTEMQHGLSENDVDRGSIGSWWTIAADPELKLLISRATSNNLDARQALARIKETRARSCLSQSALFPAVNASASTSKSKASENAGSGRTNSYFATGFDAGWELDVFGGTRRSIEAAEADLQASRENLRNVLISLTAETALYYIELRTTQKRLTVAEKNIMLQQETFEITKWRYDAGLTNELALQQARSNLESTRAQVPTLRSSLEEAKNRLSVLAGGRPGDLHDLLSEAKPIPTIPAVVAVGIPADTLRQRPDIAEAERNLAAQTARIGVATAELYPRFRLSGTIGLESLQTSTLFSSASKTWSIGPGVTWNIFDAGAIRQNIQVQTAIQEQYLIAYEAAILTALEEVENGLTLYGEEQIRQERLAAAVDAARQAQELTSQEYEAGLTDFLEVLVTQRTLLSLEDQLAVSDGTLMTNLIRLYKALGGGWSSSAVQQLMEKEGEHGQNR